MANIIARVFGRGKEEEVITESKDIKNLNERVVDTLLTSGSKISYASSDISTADEAKTITLYRHMDNDAIISAALDLYADNATQVNPKTGHVVSVECSDKKIEEELNDFLWNIVKIDTEAWQYIRDIARDGKIFLDTKAGESDGEWTFMPVEEPATIKPLVHAQDKIKYFVITPENQKNDETMNIGPLAYGYQRQEETSASGTYIVEPSTRFIAGFNTREIRGEMVIERETLGGKKLAEKLKIKSGRSILAPVVQTWQTLSALEDAMFINRLTKSTEFKIVEIDVGDSNNKQAEQIINAVRNSFRSSETIDETTNRYKNRQSPIPINDFIYVPRKGEKGQVTVTPVGGDVGQIDTSDIDYYRNKLFAGLGVLKAYLGFEETTPGGLGDNTMTKLDERLGRRVTRLQQVLKAIVEQLLEYYWKHSLVSRVNEEMPDFKIVLGKISTKEEEENRNRLQESMNIAQTLISMLKDEMFVDKVSPDKLFKYVFQDIIGVDLKTFDNTPDEDEIPLRIHKIAESIKGGSFIEKGNFLQDKYNDLFTDEAIGSLEELLDEYTIVLETDDGEVTLKEAFRKLIYKSVFNEKTYKQLKDLSKSQDPKRLAKSKKLTAKYLGIDDDNNVNFRVTAEDPQKNASEGKPTSYKVKVALKDLGYLIEYAQEDEEPIKDNELIRLALQGDVAVSCSCPAAKYWGQQYRGTKDEYSLDKNTIPPKRNIPTQVICKHTILALTVLPFWYSTLVRDLRKLGLMPSTKKTAKKTDQKSKEIKER